MEHVQPLVRDLVIPLDTYPHLNENQTLDEAIYSFMEFRAGQKERLHYAILFVVNNRSELVGKLSLMDVMRGLAPKLFEGMEVSRFDGRKGEYPALALLHEDSVFAACGKSRSRSLKSLVRGIDFTIPADTHMLKALVMMSGRNEFDVPVTDNGAIIGVLRLEEIFMTMCDTYCKIPGLGEAKK